VRRKESERRIPIPSGKLRLIPRYDGRDRLDVSSQPDRRARPEDADRPKRTTPAPSRGRTIAYFFTTCVLPDAPSVTTTSGTTHITSSWNVVSVAPVLVTVAVHPMPGGDGHSGIPS
jgi:hypothetical protein